MIQYLQVPDEYLPEEKKYGDERGINWLPKEEFAKWAETAHCDCGASMIFDGESMRCEKYRALSGYNPEDDELRFHWSFSIEEAYE
jgi:hypothetical protein